MADAWIGERLRTGNLVAPNNLMRRGRLTERNNQLSIQNHPFMARLQLPRCM